MIQSLLSADALLRCRLLTLDGAVAGLTDLILDTEGWRVRFLAADVRQWAPDRDALVTPRLVADVDEASGVVSLDLTAADLAATPPLAVRNGIAGFDEAGVVVPPNWREHWRARIQPEGGVDAPPAPAEGGEVAADLFADVDLDPERISAAQLVRAETLRGMRTETADGTVLRIQDLLIDDRDWSLAHLDLLLAADRGTRGGGDAKPLRCLLTPSGIDWLNTEAGTLYLSVWVQELRDAPTRPLPVAGNDGVKVRVLEPAA
ncbi:MAG: hypothetical protein LJE69_03165 [Thiohalocapsa sp.]|jgi:hypothetical protein|uniref:hypothetical protein n=1 Tax=Thiohalocapsa sp. TaxID=2497641 RepID=UPI0025DA612E|nr:hypothetical protein [Thiohalocapsa sp.]MCG6940234.1 hypothetical protein [Thiohalocapsa sp.]